MAAQVSHLTYFSGLAAAVGMVMALSNSCDKAIEQRITSIRQLSISEREAIHQRLDRLEKFRDREVKP